MRRILSISGLFPPNVVGGAEISASNVAKVLQERGNQVYVLTTIGSPGAPTEETRSDGVQIRRTRAHRPYPPVDFPNAPSHLKPLWHFQDHFDPRNSRPLAELVEQVKPEACVIHITQGLGHNILHVLAKLDIPIVHFLPDLGLACIRQSMFKSGHDCVGQCSTCKLSSMWKMRYISRIRRIGFVSPSKSNLKTLSNYIPLEKYPTADILNPNTYPAPSVERTSSPKLRVLYVGRIEPTKGVDLLLEAASRLATEYDLSLKIVGKGQSLENLRTKYGHREWCDFEGFLDHQSISDIMQNSDILCIPSIWAENSPGVVIHALGLGLPVIGSDRGGIPELVQHEANGLLVEAGSGDALYAALAKVAKDRSSLNKYRSNAIENSARFHVPAIADRLEKFINHVAANPRW